LVAGDDRGDENEIGFAGRDVFVHDRVTGRTSLVSRSSAGANGDAASLFPDISPDGRYVAFASSARNLIDGALDAGNPYVREATVVDDYVHDLATGVTERVSVSSTGKRANGQSFPPSISPDGHYVAFASVADNLIDDDTNEGIDVFVRDRWAHRTERVSVSSTGEQQYLGEFAERAKVNGPKPDMSWDGRYVVFTSPASNLVPRDTNGTGDVGSGTTCGSGADDVFVRDRVAGTTTRVSVSSSGTQANGASNEPSMSADGSRIAFDSWASNLVEQGVDGGPGPTPCFHSSDSFLHTIPVLH
jgi:Tol biopolymer transport system component